MNGNGESNFFQNLLKPTTFQNYFFIHIPIQQLSTYYKIKVAVPLFSEISQNKWLDVTAGASFHFNLWGGLGAVPLVGVQGVQPPGGGQGAKPPEAPAFLAF